MQKFNYTPSNPFSGSVSSLAIGAGMVVVPLAYPFGIRIGRMRILGPTAVTIIFVIGGLALLAFTVREIMQARKLIAQGGEITVEGGKVTIPVVRKKRSSTSRSCFRRWNTPNSTRRKTNSKFRCPPTITSSAARFSKTRRRSMRSSPFSTNSIAGQQFRTVRKHDVRKPAPLKLTV